MTYLTLVAEKSERGYDRLDKPGTAILKINKKTLTETNPFSFLFKILRLEKSLLIFQNIKTV